MRRSALLVVVVLALAGCAAGTGSPPLTQKSAAPAATVVSPTPAAAASTCDVTREALLTGTPADITAAMTALIADKAAPATAREYASYYVDRDKDAADMQTMDAGLIRMSCPS